MFIDSHCHLLHTFDPDQMSGSVLDLSSHLLYLIDISTTIEEFLSYRSNSFPLNVLSAFGLYPSYAELYSSDREGFKRRYAELVAQNPICAVGEIGIDLHWNYGAVLQQETLFRDQLDYAAQHGLPVVIHSRDAFADTFRVLSSYTFTQPVIIHCFGYGPSQAEQFLSQGYYLSFAGNLTYKKATDLHQAAMLTPLDRLLFETDSPYLAPVPNRGKTNNPLYVEHTYRFFSELRQLDLDTVCQTVCSNFKTAFSSALKA